MGIRKATIEDIPLIYNISQENALKRNEIKTDEQDINYGFLISDYTENDYIKFLNNNNFLILEENNEIAAFLLAFDENELDPFLIINRHIKEYATYPYLVIKQICVKKSLHGKGYASRLYKEIIEKNEKDIYAAFVIEKNIFNYRSLHFHKKFCFEHAFAVRAEDGFKRGILHYRHPCNIENYKEGEGSYSKEIIIEQYKSAIELYIHEDNLNWTKFNYFIIITGALLAVDGFLSREENLIICIAICFLGLLTSIIFSIAIKNGIQYMYYRKEMIVNIEKIIKRHKGTFVVTGEFHRRKLHRSPTIKIMKTIPTLIIIIWLFLLSRLFFI